MALATYTDLQSAIANWLARQGDTFVTTNAPDFISLCEARIAYGSEDPQAPFPSKPLRVRAMEKTVVVPVQAAVTVTTVGGTANAITLTPATAITSYSRGQTWNFAATADNTGSVTVNISGLGARSLLQGSALSQLAAADIINGQSVQLYDDGTELVYMPGTASAPLPSGYLAMRGAVYLDTNPRQTLEYETPSQADLWFSPSWPDRPQHYTIEGDTFRIVPFLDNNYNVVLPYYKKFAALSGGTNWLMTNAPNVYLSGSLLEASIFFGDTENAKFYHGLFIGACNGLQNQDTLDRHSGGLLTVRNDSGNP